MGFWDDLLNMISLTPGAEIIEVSADHIHFRGTAPLRTFKIAQADARRFRVKETTGFQTAGRNGQPTPYCDREEITRDQMVRWLAARLKELRTAA
jgi:hypothetical protein